MPKKRFSAEQIVVLLRQIEVLMSQGKATPIACREAGISQQSYYRWRKERGGLELDQAKRMKELERENVRLKRLVLCGKYLRAREGRHGILLLVHQKPRQQGWQDSDGTVLGFDDVVNHLRNMAAAISGIAMDAPQPEVAVLDVCSFGKK